MKCLNCDSFMVERDTRLWECPRCHDVFDEDYHDEAPAVELIESMHVHGSSWQTCTTCKGQGRIRSTTSPDGWTRCTTCYGAGGVVTLITSKE